MPDYTFDITSSSIAANITEETTAVEVAENVLEVNITESTLAAGLSEDTLTTNITTDSLDVIIAEGYTFAVSGTTSLSLGTVGINTVAITSDGGVDDVTLPVATNASAGMASSAHITKLEGIPSDATADQTSIVGISGTLAEFNTALSDGTFATGGGTVTGTNIGVNTGDNTVCTSGTATTATTLETPRTIGGVAFDGSANINLPGVNAVGDQDTTGNASTATTATTVSDNAITLNKMASGTTGNLLTYDTLGDPSFVTTGSATQVLTSNGAGAAPTFQTIAASHAIVTLNTTATNGGLSLDVQELNFRAATDAQTGYATAAHIQAITANTAKVTNSTHTGDVTGSTTLTIDKTAITGKAIVTALGTDYVVISDTTDSGNLKRALVSDVASAGGGTGIYWVSEMTDYWSSPMTDFWDSAMGIVVNVVLEEGDVTETTVSVVPELGTSAVLASASTLRAGLLSKTKFDEIEANTVKVGITAEQITAISHTAGMVRDNANPLLGLDLHYTSITSHATVTPASNDYMLISDTNDSSILKKVTVSSLQTVLGDITLSTNLDVNGYRIVNGSGDGMLIDTSDRLDVGGADYGTKLGGASPPPGDANFWGNFSNFRCVGGINIKGMYSDGRFGGIYIYDSDNSGNRATLVQMDSSYSTKRIILGQFSKQDDDDQIIYIGGRPPALGGATLMVRESGAVSGKMTVNSIVLDGVERSTWPTVNISNLPYHTTDWDGETTVAPSKNAIRDKIESLPGGHASVTLATSATDIGLVISGSQELSYNNLAGIKVDVTGYIGIGTMTPSTKLDVIGTVTATVFNSTSSRKLKKNIKTFKKNALKIVNSISVKEFNFKRDKKKLYRVGFIADDTDIILAGKDKNIFDVNNTVGVLLKAVQELSKKITKIERGERK